MISPPSGLIDNTRGISGEYQACVIDHAQAKMMNKVMTIATCIINNKA